MAGDAEYKQLLDVARTLAEVVSELKKTNKDLGAISKVVSKDLPKSLGEISESQKKSEEKIEKIAKDNKKESESSSKKSEDNYAEILKSIGISGDLSKKLAQLEEDQYKKSKEKSVKGALRKGGKVTEPGNYLVGENGPEIIEPPGGSKVIPLNVTDLVDGLSMIPDIKRMIKDGVLNVEPSAGDNLLVADDGKYSVGAIKKRIESEIAEDSARGIDTKGDSDKLTVLDSLNKKISEQEKSAAGNATAESIIGAKGGIGNMKLEDFYPSQSEVDAYVAKLIKEDPDIAEDGGGLDYEIDRFKFEEADRRFAEARKKAESSGAANTAPPELAKEIKEKKSLFKREKGKKSENNANPADVSKKAGAEKQKEKGRGSEIIKGGLTALNKLNESKIGSVIGAATDKKLFGGKSVSNKLVSGLSKTASGLLSKGGNEGGGKKQEAKNEKSKPALSVFNKKPEAPAPAPAPATPAPAPTTPASQPSQSSEQKSSPAKSSTNQGNAGGSQASGLGGASSELSEIKALLANISRSLSGPLNVYNPDPFRPDSKRI